MGSYRKFENAINEYWKRVEASGENRSFWGTDCRPLLEWRLLEVLLSKSAQDGDSTQSGSLAKALDMWVAEELRAAGFDAQSVWPRLSKPRVLDPSVLRFIGSLDARTAEVCCKALSQYAGSSANVLGSTYSKQVDVGLSSWMTGPEILISTKTMSSSFAKNLANRFEEAYGDAKNLKGRHPLATLGFFFMLNASIAEEPRSLSRAITMLQKLQIEDDAYDATCLLLVDWDEDGSISISARNEQVPQELSAEAFFKKVIELTLLRGAPESHELVRERRYNGTP